jgi:hypothetical protein
MEQTTDSCRLVTDEANEKKERLDGEQMGGTGGRQVGIRTDKSY